MRNGSLNFGLMLTGILAVVAVGDMPCDFDQMQTGCCGDILMG